MTGLYKGPIEQFCGTTVPLKSLYENEVWVDFVMIGMHEGELTKNSKVLPKIKLTLT